MGFATIRVRALVVSTNGFCHGSCEGSRGFGGNSYLSKWRVSQPNQSFDWSRRRFLVDPFWKGGGPVNSFVRQPRKNLRRLESSNGKEKASVVLIASGLLDSSKGPVLKHALILESSNGQEKASVILIGSVPPV